MLDSISDMLARIRNAIMAKKGEVVMPYSKIKFNLSKILEKEKLIEKVEILESAKVAVRRKENENRFSQIKLILKYDAEGRPIINNLKRISRPGRRLYVKKDDIPRVLNGFGLAIISTPRGLMTGEEARKKQIGGEVICEIW